LERADRQDLTRFRHAQAVAAERNLNYSGLGHSNFPVLEEGRDQQLVDERSVILGIVPEI
jgi:hypothetical protein